MTCPDRSTSPDAMALDGRAPGRVQLFLKGFGPGGVERIALRLADGWRGAGIDVALAVAQDAGPMQRTGGAYHVVRPWPLIGRGAPMLRLAIWLARQVRRDPPALIFCPGNAYTIAAVLLKLMTGRRCPPILAKISNDLTRRDMPGALRPFYRLWLRVQGRVIDHFAVLSASMGDEVAALMRVPRDRIHVVPNPVLADADIAAHPVRADHAGTAGRRFVAVGRLEPQKDYPAMLRAFAVGRRPGDRLTLYGDGGQRQALAALTAHLGLTSIVDIAGFVPDIGGRLADQDILLLSSRYEGQPGAVVEALAAGLAIVATRCCAGMADLLDDGALGMLIEVGDEAALARAIADAWPGQADPARALAKARLFTIERAVPAYAALFGRIIALRSGQAVARHSPFLPEETWARPA